MTAEAAISAVAQDVRAVLETLWPDWHAARGRALPTPPSRGTCQTSSLFLATCLNQQGWAALVAQGNAPGRNEGYFNSGTWHGHAWVLCAGWIVDVTADQFGAAPVQMVRQGDPNYQPGPRDTATADAIRFRQDLVNQGLPRWQALRGQSCSTLTESDA